MPTQPVGTFDIIICNYVLNVVDESSQLAILSKIKSLLSEDGMSYITVRRDIQNDYTTKYTEQYVVVLDLETKIKTKSFEMYVANKLDLQRVLKGHLLIM
jgi:chemotaxis methyl-accepting protein methylase